MKWPTKILESREDTRDAVLLGPAYKKDMLSNLISSKRKKESINIICKSK